MAKVTLDMETFKALASDTRLQVLRALDERRKTLSELSREVELNKATVHEHLALLTATGLVKKCDEEGRKWIYYELSWRGQRLLHPQETTTFSILLGLAIAAAGGGVLVLGRALEWWMAERPIVKAGDDPGNEAGDMEGTSPSASSENSSSEGSVQEGESASNAPQADYDDSSNATGAAPEFSELQGDDAAAGDDEGILAILLLITSALMAGLAWATMKFRRRN